MGVHLDVGIALQPPVVAAPIIAPPPLVYAPPPPLPIVPFGCYRAYGNPYAVVCPQPGIEIGVGIGGRRAWERREYEHRRWEHYHR